MHVAFACVVMYLAFVGLLSGFAGSVRDADRHYQELR
jgi:hypothetical protein